MRARALLDRACFSQAPLSARQPAGEPVADPVRRPHEPPVCRDLSLLARTRSPARATAHAAPCSAALSQSLALLSCPPLFVYHSLIRRLEYPYEAWISVARVCMLRGCVSVSERALLYLFLCVSRCFRGETVRTEYSTCSDVDTHGHAHSCAHQRINDAFALAGGFRNTCGCARRADVCAVLCLLHRYLYVRCDPSWTPYYCAAELDNPGLTCVPLTQASIAGLSTYYGPTSTCEVRRMRIPGLCAPC